MKVTIVIDAFRAFATASYILEQGPATYRLAQKDSVIERLASALINPLLVGKPEKGTDFKYHIPNSPTRVLEVKAKGRDVLHRTEAGAQGVLRAHSADLILAAAFVNASATIRYVKQLKSPQVTIVPMGHEGVTPSLEDQVCACYIEALIEGKKMELSTFIPELRKGPGQYFFSNDQWQYPKEDFERCLEIDRFDFAIQAKVEGDYSTLTRCQASP